jgi:hypothetical protein
MIKEFPWMSVTVIDHDAGGRTRSYECICSSDRILYNYLSFISLIGLYRNT